MADYKTLRVWQKATTFCVRIYKITYLFPKHEKFGLSSQPQRASVSIPLNIAEGSKRPTDKNFSSFLRIALGSGAEIETQLYIAKELTYITQKEYEDLTKDLSEIMKILVMLIKKLD